LKTPDFQIPEQMRQLAEQNVEQARTAYGQFMDMTKQAQDMAAKSQGAMVESAIEVQARALKYAEKSVEASFEFATELAKAKDVQQYVEIQTRYAQSQMQSFSEQASELNRMMTEAAAKATKR